MPLEIRHLKLVAAIAETGSVTRAGNRLHLTQSALSHQLRDAEQQLGAPLFERRNRQMILTTAGERLLCCARTVLEELERTEKQIQTSNGDAITQGILRLSTECYTVYHWLPPRLKLFQRKFPAVEFQLAVDATDQPFEALLDGKLDLAIVCTPIRNRRIHYTSLFEDEVVLVVPPGHWLTRNSYVAPRDLAEETVFVVPPKSDSTLLHKILAPAGVTPRRVQEVALTEAIIEMVRGGMGVASLAKWAVLPQLESGELIGLRVTERGWMRTWSAAQLRDKNAPAYVGEFIRLLREHPIPTSISRRRVLDGKRALPRPKGLRGDSELAVAARE
jgi:LysR family transcriptional regulator, regulator for metE and metH